MLGLAAHGANDGRVTGEQSGNKGQGQLPPGGQLVGRGYCTPALSLSLNQTRPEFNLMSSVLCVIG